MARKMRAIEIAEGALLADIAVIFHLIATYLPFGSGFLRTLVFVAFCVLVLRRGLYTGCMALSVSLFIVGVLAGISGVPLMFLEASGGLFLGVTMRRHMRHIPLVLLGATCGAFALYGLLLFLGLLTGLGLVNLLRSLHLAFQIFVQVASSFSARVGLALWWSHQVYPVATALFNLALTYWWLTLFLAVWVLLCPMVLSIYVVTNTLVRLLGYDVRPLPGGKVDKLLRRLRRKVARLARRLHSIKTSGSRA